jgi:hypothetical protein
MGCVCMENETIREETGNYSTISHAHTKILQISELVDRKKIA